MRLIKLIDMKFEVHCTRTWLDVTNVIVEAENESKAKDEALKLARLLPDEMFNHAEVIDMEAVEAIVFYKNEKEKYDAVLDLKKKAVELQIAFNHGNFPLVKERLNKMLFEMIKVLEGEVRD
jgi:hypothetical protein